MNNRRSVAVLAVLLGLIVGVSGASEGQIRPPTTTKTPLQPLDGPAPTGFRVSGTPLVAQLSWDAMPNAVRYALWRSDGVSPAIERMPAGFPGTKLQDTVPDPRPTWNYSVVAHYADGSLGTTPVVQFVSPPLVNPSGFTARHLGGGNVALQWQAVPGAAQYRLDGPGIPGTGRYQAASAVTIPAAPAGPGTWKVTALYPGNFADYVTGTLAQAIVRVLPSRSTPWLSKNNGSGSPALAQAHSSQLCGVEPSCLTKVGLVLPWGTQPGFKQWGDPFSDGQSFFDQSRNEAVYGNTGDLGFGRRTGCQQWFLGPPAVPGMHTICYTTSHGPGPGELGFADPQLITRAAAGVDITLPGGVVHNAWGGMPRSATMIIKDPTGTTFLALTPGVWDMNNGYQPSLLSWPTWAQPPQVMNAIAFDTEGPKAVPHSCIACHGGIYDPATRKVQGASLLPLDPGLLAFSGSWPGDRQSQEENIRKINRIVLYSSPSAAVMSYVQGLYNGAVAQAGARAVSDYVPAGWAPQSGFYRSVVRPYCTMCHLAAPATVSFSSWGNFQQNAAAIHTSVCKTHTMPHAEIAFKEFWLKDTGPLFLPGLLAATLGFPSCD